MITFFNPVPMIFTGPGVIHNIHAHLAERGFRRPFIVTDKGVTGLPFFEGFRRELGESALFDKTQPNPPDVQVHEGAEMYRRERCDCLIAVGGGSPMDCAKGIGAIAANGGKIHDYTEKRDSLAKPIPYLAAVPTTAGSGSECTAAAIITNTQGTHRKMALLSHKLLPGAAFVDSEIMMGLPPFLTAITGLDALSHAIEAYVAVHANEYTDGLAFNAIRLIFKYLPVAVANGQDAAAREKMAYAQTMAGLAFNCAGLGAVHSLSHPLSAIYNIPHGLANAILMPSVIEFNMLARFDKTVEIAEAAGENIWGRTKRDAALLAAKAVRLLASDLGCCSSISEAAKLAGREADFDRDIDILVNEAMNDIFREGNPRQTRPADFRAIYAACWLPETVDLVGRVKNI